MKLCRYPMEHRKIRSQRLDDLLLPEMLYFRIFEETHINEGLVDHLRTTLILLYINQLNATGTAIY